MAGVRNRTVTCVLLAMVLVLAALTDWDRIARQLSVNSVAARQQDEPTEPPPEMEIYEQLPAPLCNASVAMPPLEPQPPAAAPDLVQQFREAYPGLRGLRIPENLTALPTVYVITPTYPRYTQKADLLRLCYVPKVFWVVIEDSYNRTSVVKDVIVNCGVPFLHALQRTPVSQRIRICKMVDPKTGCKRKRLGKANHRGVVQRNRGLFELRRLRTVKEGVVYFADDDNTYSLNLFDEIRNTVKVSVLPVAFTGGALVEGPIVNSLGKVIDWQVGWRSFRKYPVDMAGFAINIKEVFSRPTLQFDIYSKRGFLESDFISKIVSGLPELEPKGVKCNCVMEIPALKLDV